MFDPDMEFVLRQPEEVRLDEVVHALREWQHTTAPMQLHQGDLGWLWQLGAAATSAAIRIWTQGEQIVAISMLDGPTLLRLTTAPQLMQVQELAVRLAADICHPQRDVLPAGRVSVEAPVGAVVADVLASYGWMTDDPWQPLKRDLSAAVEDSGVRIEVVGPEQAHLWCGVHRASFGSTKFTIDRWRAMAGGLPYVDGRCLLAYDSQNVPAAMVAVWSAGPGKPGILEPMGVHPEHRGHGFGRAVTIAAAAALRDMGASAAMVCTPSANVGAVATYESAGFAREPERCDRYRGV